MTGERFVRGGLPRQVQSDLEAAAALTFPEPFAQVFTTGLAQLAALADHFARYLCLEIAAAEEWEPVLATPVAPAELMRCRGYPECAEPLITYVLRQLAAGGWVTRRGGGTFCAALPWPLSEAAAIRAHAEQMDARSNRTFALYAKAATVFAPALRGDGCAEQLFLGSRALRLWLDYFDNENVLYGVGNQLLALVASDCVAELAAGDDASTEGSSYLRERAPQGVRILELGAGGGSACQAILAHLNKTGLTPCVSEYVVSDRERTLLGFARRALSEAPAASALRYLEIDFERDLGAQGVALGSFDMIVAANALHAAKDLVPSLRRVSACLRPGGRLLISEGVRPVAEAPLGPELFFLLMRSFSEVTLDPELRPNAGFLAPRQWGALLAHAGFDDVRTVPDFEAAGSPFASCTTATFRATLPNNQGLRYRVQ
ncbi:MAG: class I SAM-dependent methyltransferase [Candidatus Schekmanbacteria bacterium]|nr:class I SAM-dependent methyltransferase [Candidatus Schekmanbacteria bacterium]